jgi:glycosyltransferase involved in cell wall biosynthesis
MDYARITRIQNFYYGMSNKYFIKILTYLLTVVAFFCNFPYYVYFFSVLVREKPDLVHINSSCAALAISVLLSKRIIFHLHRPHTSLNIIHRLLFYRVDIFIAVSHYVKQSFPLQKTANVQVLHNPVEMKACREPKVYRQKFGIGPEKKIVAIFGRLVRWKGHRQFLKALQKVVAHDEDVLGLVVGGGQEFGGTYEKELREYVHELGIARHVVFTGHVRDVACMYEISEIVVHASIRPEAFGLVIVEAMAFGKPVIVSDLGAPREILDDGAGGFIVNPHDTELLTAKMSQLLTDRGLYARFARINHKKAEGYSLGSYIQKIERLYAQLITERQ